MNSYLAQLYNTDGHEKTAGDSLEKTAAQVLLVKIAEENDIDLSDIDLDDISEEDLHEILSELASEEGEGADQDSEKTSSAEEAFQEKLAEADFLGRAMAHAYVAELKEIEAGVGGQEKQASAFETLAEARAVEIAQHYGLMKTAEEDDSEFQDAVDTRALEMLVEHGLIDPSDLE